MSDITDGGSASHRTEEFEDHCSTGSEEGGKYSPISFYPRPQNDVQKIRSSSPIASMSSSRNTSGSDHSNSFSESFSRIRSQPGWVEPDNSKAIQVNARDLPPKKAKTKKAGGVGNKKKSKSHQSPVQRMTRSRSKQTQSTETFPISSPIREEVEEGEQIYGQQTIYEQSVENILLLENPLEERKEHVNLVNNLSKEDETPAEEADFENQENTSHSIESTRKNSLTLNIVGLQGLNNQTVQPFNIVIPSDNEIKTVNISFNQEKIGSPKIKQQTEEKYTSPMQSTSSGFICNLTPKNKGKMENLTCPFSKKPKQKSTTKKKSSPKKRKNYRKPAYSDSSSSYSSSDSSSDYDSSDSCHCSLCSDGYDSYTSSSDCCCKENYKCPPKKQVKKRSKKKSQRK